MTFGLDTWGVADRLYLARAYEVSQHRPLFTGDVLEAVRVPGVQNHGLAIVMAHPCEMRGKQAKLADRVLMAAVEPAEPVRSDKWRKGFYDRMPLPDLLGVGTTLHVAWLNRLGLAEQASILQSNRLACLSSLGVSMLQQRLVFHLTRFEVPTATLWEAFAHTYEEADLLEEWNERLAGHGSQEELSAQFDQWLRDGDRQTLLRDAQQRAPVRSEMRAEIRRRQTSG